jgi:hypothetical protein
LVRHTGGRPEPHDVPWSAPSKPQAAGPVPRRATGSGCPGRSLRRATPGCRCAGPRSADPADRPFDASAEDPRRGVRVRPGQFHDVVVKRPTSDLRRELLGGHAYETRGFELGGSAMRRLALVTRHRGPRRRATPRHGPQQSAPRPIGDDDPGSHTDFRAVGRPHIRELTDGIPMKPGIVLPQFIALSVTPATGERPPPARATSLTNRPKE